MSTALTTRMPTWLRLLNTLGSWAGPVLRALTPLDDERLMARARRRTGLHDFGADDFREGLRVLTESLDPDPALTTYGRIWARTYILSALEARLAVEHELAVNPAIADVPIAAPLIVFGLPRTGSTLLHNLLATDPNRRAPPMWELLQPCPPRRPEDPVDGRRAEALRKVGMFYAGNPTIKSAHLVGADRPDECFVLLQNALREVHFETGFGCEPYRAWLLQQDMAPAYAYLRRQLQILMLHWPEHRLTLKYPYHLCWLDTVVETFPDGLFVQTHRDPTEVVASIASLMAMSQSVARHPVDRAGVGRRNLEEWSGAVATGMRVRDARPDDRTFDLRYPDLLEDPIGAVSAIYDHFDLPLVAEMRAGMERYLRDNAQHKHGRHHYRLEDWGLTEVEVNEAFSAYRDRYGV